MTKLSQLSPQEAPPPYNPSRAVSFLFEYHNIAPGGGVGSGAGSITQGPNSPVFTWKAAYEHIQWYIDNQSGLPGSWLRVGAGLVDWPGEKTGPRPPICGYVGSENGYVADPVLGGCSMKLLRQVFMKLVASPRGGRATRQVTRAPASMPTRQITRTVAPKRGRVVRRRFPGFGFFGAIAAPVQQPSFGDGAAYRLRVHHLGKTGGWGGFTSPWVRHIGSAAALYVAGSEELPVLYNKAKTGAVYQIESEAGGNRTTVGKGHWGDSGTPSYSPAQMANVREGLRLQRMYYYKQPGAPLRNEHPLEAASGFLLQHMYSSPRAALENIMDDKWCGSSYLGSSWPLSYVSAVVGFDCGGCYPGGKATLEEKLRIISTLVYNSLVRNAVYGAAPISSAQAAAQLDKMIADCQRKKTASRARLPAARPIARTHSPTPVTTITRQVTRAPASMPTRQITRKAHWGRLAQLDGVGQITFDANQSEPTAPAPFTRPRDWIYVGATAALAYAVASAVPKAKQRFTPPMAALFAGALAAVGTSII